MPFLDIVLVAPDIPPNVGNVIRLAANTGSALHLVEPLGFSMDDRQLRRAGLDYHDMVHVQTHKSWAACGSALEGRRMFAFSTRATASFAGKKYAPGDVFVFGSETRGLPTEVLALFGDEWRVRIPMQPNNRSINLSNAVAVAVFEAWRQLGFPGAG